MTLKSEEWEDAWNHAVNAKSFIQRLAYTRFIFVTLFYFNVNNDMITTFYIYLRVGLWAQNHGIN